jgi:4-amino-4-deoxy-L-arabinose transferase-like glycosyltransferase
MQNLKTVVVQFKNENKLPIIVTTIFFFTFFYVSFFHHLTFTESDGIFYYLSGKQLISGNVEYTPIIGAPIGGPLVHALFGDLLDDPFVAGKIISLLSCTGVVFTSFFITKNLFSKKVAILTQLFFAVNPKIAHLSIMVLNEAAPLFFIFISLYFATKKQKSNTAFVLVGIFLGIAFCFRYQAGFILIAFLVYLLIFERERIFGLRNFCLTLFPFLATISPLLIFNNLILGKFSTLSTNFYFLDLFKFQTETWRQNMVNIADEGIFSAFFLDPFLFLKNYFYNLLFHNPDHLFKFSVDVYDTLSIIPLFPILGILPAIGGFLYITKINLNKKQLSILLSTFFITFLLIGLFGTLEYHFMLLVIIPLSVIGITNIHKIPNNVLFLLISCIIFLIFISVLPVYRAFHLFPIWLILPALSSLFFIEAIPVIQTKIRQSLHLGGSNNEI